MKRLGDLPDPFRGGTHRDDGGAYILRRHGLTFQVIASWGGGWDHVSVTLPNRCPSWEEMAWICDQFFDAEETVMQLHPPRSQYVNNHPYCLHLWRPQNQTIPMPPSDMVGVVGTDIA